MRKIAALGLIGLLGTGAYYYRQSIIDNVTQLTSREPLKLNVKLPQGTLGPNVGYIPHIILSHDGDGNERIRIKAAAYKAGKEVPKLSDVHDFDVGKSYLVKTIRLLPLDILDGRAGPESVDDIVIYFETHEGYALRGGFYIRMTPEVIAKYRADRKAWREFVAVPPKSY